MLTRFGLLLCFLLACLAAPPPLHARGSGDRVHILRSITVEEGEDVGDVVCIVCSIHMSGRCGDVVAVVGSITIDGTVTGDAVAVAGGMYLGENASVAGDVVAVGGRLHRSPDAVIKGDVSSQNGVLTILALFVGLVLIPLLPVVLIVALVVWLVRPNRPRVPRSA